MNLPVFCFTSSSYFLRTSVFSFCRSSMVFFMLIMRSLYWCILSINLVFSSSSESIVLVFSSSSFQNSTIFVRLFVELVKTILLRFNEIEVIRYYITFSKFCRNSVLSSWESWYWVLISFNSFSVTSIFLSRFFVT